MHPHNGSIYRLLHNMMSAFVQRWLYYPSWTVDWKEAPHSRSCRQWNNIQCWGYCTYCFRWSLEIVRGVSVSFKMYLVRLVVWLSLLLISERTQFCRNNFPLVHDAIMISQFCKECVINQFHCSTQSLLEGGPKQADKDLRIWCGGNQALLDFIAGRWTVFACHEICKNVSYCDCHHFRVGCIGSS